MITNRLRRDSCFPEAFRSQAFAEEIRTGRGNEVNVSAPSFDRLPQSDHAHDVAGPDGVRRIRANGKARGFWRHRMKNQRLVQPPSMVRTEPVM